MVEIKNGENMRRIARNKALPIFNNRNVEMGILILTPGTRLPEEGYSVHRSNEEYAYVLEGEILFCTDEKCHLLKQGDFMYNPPGTPHYTENKGEKEAKIIWVVSPPL